MKSVVNPPWTVIKRSEQPTEPILQETVDGPSPSLGSSPPPTRRVFSLTWYRRSLSMRPSRPWGVLTPGFSYSA